MAILRWTWVSWYQNISILDFIGAKDDGGGDDNWCNKICKARVKTLPPTNQHPTSYRLDVLPITQPTVSEYWRENNLTLTSHQSYFHQNIISLKDFVMHKIFILLSGVVSDHRQENGSFRSHTLERGWNTTACCAAHRYYYKSVHFLSQFYLQS